MEQTKQKKKRIKVAEQKVVFSTNPLRTILCKRGQLSVFTKVGIFSNTVISYAWNF
jgi:hypothetical protein